MKEKMIGISGILFFVAVMYLMVSWFAFEWRNPTCNDTAFFRHFGSVVTWQRLPQYQEKE
jgi:hypothetical protein